MSMTLLWHDSFCLLKDKITLVTVHEEWMINGGVQAWGGETEEALHTRQERLVA